ncbi:MAG: hypothetical protein ACXWT0_00240 [Methylobacter sp.]
MTKEEKRPSQVTREYIAKKLGITAKMLSEYAHKGKVKLPPVVFKKRSTMYYAIELSDKFIASKRLDKDNMLVCEGKKPKRPQLYNGLVLEFIRPKRHLANDMAALAANLNGIDDDGTCQMSDYDFSRKVSRADNATVQAAGGALSARSSGTTG